ncbi:hypothetical protein T11_745 [Trichinella zimbabwensis]|uniref:Uncharacterized protein n=1 Tax=Trichinella zimbabwensis TaxID=268475 RepID=A0A0V1GUG4_9BILA|nr:hypothetical protein T11_745 [Trichinella zimbabwensis]
MEAIVIGRHFEMSDVPSIFGMKIVRLAFTDTGSLPAFNHRLKRLAMSKAFSSRNFCSFKPSGPTAVGRAAFNSRATSTAVIG